MTPRCPDCPLAPGETCPALMAMCNAIRGDAGKRAAFLARCAEVAAAAEYPPVAIPVQDSIRATQLGFHRCWFSTKDSACGCSGVRCHLLKRIVGLADCVECLSH